MTWWKYFAGLLAIYLTSKFFEFRKNVQKLSNLPGLRSVFSPISALGPLIPTCSWNPGFSWQWKWRNQVYSKYGVQTMSVIPYLSGTPGIYTCSMDVVRQNCVSQRAIREAGTGLRVCAVTAAFAVPMALSHRGYR
ncbi:hypothetical protein B0H19DRAFT_381900 [Mycena capillaripes]|nr:hypothetical protein B0H19DRAFT_381900 [Mycena capillaripes]